MQIRRTSTVQNSHAVNLQTRTQSSTSANAKSSVPVDQLDISAEAQMISQSNAPTDIRMDRVTELRAQIANGQYETPEKIDAAVTRLLDQLG